MRYPAIEQRVAMITRSLNDIFEREHTLSLDRLKTHQPSATPASSSATCRTSIRSSRPT